MKDTVFKIGLGIVLCCCTCWGQRVMERLDRGVVAVDTSDGVLVSWRLLADDPNNVAFNVYYQEGRGGISLLNNDPITDRTCWLHPKGTRQTPYQVVTVINGQEQEATDWILPWRKSYLSVPLETPSGYTPNDASVGDLDGDGQYEIVLHQTGASQDNANAGFTDPPILEAYELDGTLLWRINLGINIREGAHYTQFMVYDLDSDGRAEVACKTADGSVDGLGTVIGDADADYRNSSGYILSGPEYLTIFDGLTGAALVTTDYVPPRHPDTLYPSGSQLQAIWGDKYGNRCDRFLACVAYLDGQEPSLVMCRGYYYGRSGTPGRTVLAAWNWRGGQLTLEWTFDSMFGDSVYSGYRGQGNHNLSVADVDGDGKDEIVYGGMCIDHDGTGLYNTHQGHGDAMHLTDFDPGRPGLEVWRCVESDATGAVLTDAATGEVLVEFDNSSDVGRACACDIDPDYLGCEMWATSGCPVYSSQGQILSTSRPSVNFAVWWDGDLLRELLDGTRISKWNPSHSSTSTLLSGSGVSSNNSTKATPTLSADILGDWREEVIWRSSDNQELRIYATPYETDRRLVTLMHDSVYRLGVAWQNVAYNQPPHTGFYLGVGMDDPCVPDVILPGEEVFFGYADCDFNDLTVALTGPGTYTAADLTGLGFDRGALSSLRIESPWQVTFYTEDDFSGSHETVTEDQPCLDTAWMP